MFRGSSLSIGVCQAELLVPMASGNTRTCARKYQALADRAAEACLPMGCGFQTLKQPGLDQPHRGGWKGNTFWSDEITLDNLMKKKCSDPTEPLND